MLLENTALGTPPTSYILQHCIHASFTGVAGATQLYTTIPLLM